MAHGDGSILPENTKVTTFGIGWLNLLDSGSDPQLVEGNDPSWSDWFMHWVLLSKVRGAS